MNKYKGSESTIIDSLEDIIDEMVTVLPKTDYHFDLVERKPTGRQISDYKSKIRKKPGKKLN